MERKELKELLVSIKDNDYGVPENVKPYELCLEMMNYIGDVDAELRDDLVLSNLYKWMVDDILTLEEIHNILNICVDDKHLLNGLGENGDKVFSRTFSVLVIAIAIYKHRSNSYLSKVEVENVFDKVLKFYNEDKDVRGYIEEKGWAHGAAHGADALDEFARCEEIGNEGLTRILDAIHNKININHYSYVHEEDERTVTAVLAVIERKIINEKEIVDWINRFREPIKIGKFPEDMIARVNAKNFLRSLYFRLARNSEYNNLTNAVKEVLESTSRFK